MTAGIGFGQEPRDVEREARLYAIIETATDGIISADSHGDILHVNRAAEQMFGYTNSDLVGRPLSMLMPERYRAAHHAGLARFLAGGEARAIGRTMELAGLRKDGQEFPIELSLAVCTTAGCTVFTGILRDITWRKQAERELADQRAELEAVNKELEAFSYSVSHDLRTPLRSIQGFSQVLLEDCQVHLNEQGRDALRRICAAVQRMERLIDAMLALSRVARTELHYGTIDLSAIARTVAADLRRYQPERSVEFVIRDAVTARGDSQLIQVVLENLFGNAWKATAQRPCGRIEFGVSEEHGRRTFFVRDNGIGFDPVHAHRLFGALQTLHHRTEFPGTGIGLATMRRIITRHGGSAWAIGEPDKGAVFSFTL